MNDWFWKKKKFLIKNEYIYKLMNTDKTTVCIVSENGIGMFRA